MSRAGTWFLGGVAAALLGTALTACNDDGEGTSTPTSGDAGADPAACTETQVLGHDGACVDVGFVDCGDAFEPTETGCHELLAVACGPTQMPVVGRTSCERVGPTACGRGFTADESGYGCVPRAEAGILCTGAARETADGCVPVGTCSDAFPPMAATLFVALDAVVDATHFRSLSAAIGAASPGVTIAVAKGVYAEALELTKSVNIVGTCAGDVVLDGGGGTSVGITVDTAGATITLEGLTLRGFRGGVSVGSGAQVDLVDTVIEDNRQFGLRVDDPSTRVSVASSAVHRTSAEDATTGAGAGILVANGALLSLDQVAVTGSREAAVDVRDDATATLTDAFLGSTKGRASTEPGRGLWVGGGAKVTVTATVIDASVGDGIAVDGAELHVTGSTVRGVASRSGQDEVPTGVRTSGAATFDLAGLTIVGSDGAGISAGSTSAGIVRDSAIAGTGGNGLLALSRAKVEARNVVVTNAHGLGLGAQNGGSIRASNVFVHRTRDASGVAYAVVAANGSSIEADGLTVDDTTGTSLLSFGKNSTITGDHVLVRDTRILKNSFGIGVQAEEGGAVVLHASVVERAGSIGAIAKGARLDLEGVVVRETAGAGDHLSGFGLVAIEKSTVTVRGAGFFDNALSGILAGHAGTTLTAEAITIRGTRFDREAAMGLAVQDGADVTLTHGYLTDNGQTGIGVFGIEGQEPSFLGIESIVEATRQTDDGAFGHGVFAHLGRLDLDQVTVRHQPGIALAYADAHGRVSGGAVEHNAVGVHVQGEAALEISDDPDEAPEGTVRISSTTRFGDNQTRVGSGDIPLPKPLGVPK